MSGRLKLIVGEQATVARGTDLPVVKPLVSMPGVVGGADQDFAVPKGLTIDRP